MLDAINRGALDLSHPSRVRGLKSNFTTRLLGAEMSHPSRVRGLKYIVKAYHFFFEVSHPSRVRGLKCLLSRFVQVKQ